jgi:hypothetical protein
MGEAKRSSFDYKFGLLLLNALYREEMTCYGNGTGEEYVV